MSDTRAAAISAGRVFGDLKQRVDVRHGDGLGGRLGGRGMYAFVELWSGLRITTAIVDRLLTPPDRPPRRFPVTAAAAGATVGS